MAISDKDDFRVCGHLALVDAWILLLVAELVKRQLFSCFEFEVLDGFFEFGHVLGPVGDGQS